MKKGNYDIGYEKKNKKKFGVFNRDDYDYRYIN